MEQNERRFAVLIDADNVSPKYIKYILDEVSDIGIATHKRICGDWTDNEKRAWKNVLLDWSVNPSSSTATPPAKCHRFRHDHRRHGYSVFGKCRRLLPGIQRFGLYQAGPGTQTQRSRCLSWASGAENPVVPGSLRYVWLLEIISSEDAADRSNKQRAGNALTAAKTEVPSIDETSENHHRY